MTRETCGTSFPAPAAAECAALRAPLNFWSLGGVNERRLCVYMYIYYSSFFLFVLRFYTRLRRWLIVPSAAGNTHTHTHTTAGELTKVTKSRAFGKVESHSHSLRAEFHASALILFLFYFFFFNNFFYPTPKEWQCARKIMWIVALFSKNYK